MAAVHSMSPSGSSPGVSHLLDSLNIHNTAPAPDDVSDGPDTRERSRSNNEIAFGLGLGVVGPDRPVEARPRRLFPPATSPVSSGGADGVTLSVAAAVAGGVQPFQAALVSTTHAKPPTPPTDGPSPLANTVPGFRRCVSAGGMVPPPYTVEKENVAPKRSHRTTTVRSLQVITSSEASDEVGMPTPSPTGMPPLGRCESPTIAARPSFSLDAIPEHSAVLETAAARKAAADDADADAMVDQDDDDDDELVSANSSPPATKVRRTTDKLSMSTNILHLEDSPIDRLVEPRRSSFETSPLRPELHTHGARTAPMPRPRSLDISPSSPSSPTLSPRSMALLPTVADANMIEFPAIDPRTVVGLLTGEYDHLGKRILFVDCRFPYEHNGGHIKGAHNLHMVDQLDKMFLEQELPNADQVIVVFYCEFSSHRAPKMCRYLRSEDRKRNAYPKLTYPHLYVLKGGYKGFFETFPGQCFPPHSYVPMQAPGYESQCRENMREMRRKWKRSRSWSVGSTVPSFNTSP